MMPECLGSIAFGILIGILATLVSVYFFIEIEIIDHVGGKMLNKQGPTKIDWTDYTWNPIAGCLHGCNYCYMLRMEKRFPGIMTPKFRPHYLADPNKKKKPLRIFIGSSGDMWGDWVDGGWIVEVLNVCKQAEQHTFQFLTKNPMRYFNFLYLPENGWYGTTVDGTAKTAYNIDYLKSSVMTKHIRFISFEPLLAPVEPNLTGIDWIIIGANSNKGAARPPVKWADNLIARAKELNIPVWVKNNYNYPKIVKQFPSDKL